MCFSPHNLLILSEQGTLSSTASINSTSDVSSLEELAREALSLHSGTHGPVPKGTLKDQLWGSPRTQRARLEEQGGCCGGWEDADPFPGRRKGPHLFSVRAVRLKCRTS